MSIELFDRVELTEIKILDALSQRIFEISVTELAEEIDHSKGTTRKYLDVLQERINQNYSDEDIELIVNKKTGILLKVAPDFDFHPIYTMILKETLLYDLVEGLLYETLPAMEFFARDHFTSVTSVRRKVAQLKQILEVYGVHFKFIYSGLEGEEHQIRMFFYQFYWQIYQGSEWPFKKVDRQRLLNIFEVLERNFQTKIDSVVKEKFLYWLAVSTIRNQCHNQIDIADDTTRLVLNNPSYEEFEKIAIPLFRPFVKNNPQAETIFFYFMLNTITGVDKTEEVWHLNAEMHETKKTLVYQASIHWLNVFERFFQLEISESDRKVLTNQLLKMHSYSYLFQGEVFLLHTQTYLDELRLLKPLFFHTVQDFYQELVTTSPDIIKGIYDNRDYLLPLYAALCELRINAITYEPEIRVGIRMGDSAIYQRQVQLRIQSGFAKKYHIRFVHFQEAHDLLVTDLCLLTDRKDVPMVKIQSQMTRKDVYNIWNMLDYVTLKKRQEKREPRLEPLWNNSEMDAIVAKKI